MGIEIERKFLVIGDAWRTPTGVAIGQGYLNRDKNRTVRVRLAGGQAYLTIKGPSRGATRQEFEYSIPVKDALQLLELCDGTPIRKTRHLVQHDGNRWEVDEFHAENHGLVVAEIELDKEDRKRVAKSSCGGTQFLGASCPLQPRWTHAHSKSRNSNAPGWSSTRTLQ